MNVGTVTVTLLRRTLAEARDDYGNDVYQAEERVLSGCYLWPRMSAEGSVEARNQVVSGLWLLAPSVDEQIRSTDQVRIDEDLYDVEGEPGTFANRSATVAFQQVALERVTG